MNAPKPAPVHDDSERLVRQFLDAVNSLQTPTVPATCRSSSESEQEYREIETRPDKNEIFEQFRRDHELMERLGVTSQEIQALSSSSLLGSLTCKQDVVFMLHQIREATNLVKPEATVPRKPVVVPARSSEELPSDVGVRVEHLRREALARMAQATSLPSTLRGGALRQFGVQLSALVLGAALIWNCMLLISSWLHHR